MFPPHNHAHHSSAGAHGLTDIAPAAIIHTQAGPAGGSFVGNLLAGAAARGASDLILVADCPPTCYVSGTWLALEDRPIDAHTLCATLRDLLSEEQQARLDEHRDLDLAIVLPDAGRYRVNLHYQRGTLAAAFRAIPTDVPGFESLNLPRHVLSFADYPNGLVLITGGTGQGKSTTLATLVDHINQTRSAHIITIEDPVEFTLTSHRSLIEQREIGDDSPSFASALRHVLRQRPDVIVIGEMRDLETISTALTAAETGHLVLGSLHTSSTAQTLARIIDVFPPVQQPQIRVQLAASLRAIVCQTLVRDRLNESLVPATEILVATSAVRRALRDNEAHLIYSMIETGRTHGMHTLEQSLADLIKAGRIETDEALAATTDRGRLARILGISARSDDALTAAMLPKDAHTTEIPWAESSH